MCKNNRFIQYLAFITYAPLLWSWFFPIYLRIKFIAHHCKDQTEIYCLPCLSTSLSSDILNTLQQHRHYTTYIEWNCCPYIKGFKLFVDCYVKWRRWSHFDDCFTCFNTFGASCAILLFQWKQIFMQHKDVCAVIIELTNKPLWS